MWVKFRFITHTLEQGGHRFGSVLFHNKLKFTNQFDLKILKNWFGNFYSVHFSINPFVFFSYKTPHEIEKTELNQILLGLVQLCPTLRFNILNKVLRDILIRQSKFF